VVAAIAAVLVLDLGHDHRPAVLDQQRFDHGPHLLHVLLGQIQELGVFGADRHLAILEQPSGEAAEIPLRANVGAGPHDHEQPLFLRRLDELAEVVVAAEIPLARRRLVNVPEHVRADRVQPHRLRHLQPRAPILVGNARIVHLAGSNDERLSVQHEMLSLNGKGVRRRQHDGGESGKHAKTLAAEG